MQKKYVSELPRRIMLIRSRNTLEDAFLCIIFLSVSNRFQGMRAQNLRRNVLCTLTNDGCFERKLAFIRFISIWNLESDINSGTIPRLIMHSHVFFAIYSLAIICFDCEFRWRKVRGKIQQFIKLVKRSASSTTHPA